MLAWNWRMACDWIARLIAALNRSTIGRGTPVGAITPHQVGERRRAVIAGDRRRPHRAGAGERRDRIKAFEHQLHAAGHQIVDCWRAALVRHVDNVGAGHELEQLAADMARRSIAG